MTPPDDSALIAEAERLADASGMAPLCQNWRASFARHYHRLKSENWQPEDEAVKVWGDAYRSWNNANGNIEHIAVIRAALDAAEKRGDQRGAEREREANAVIAEGYGNSNMVALIARDIRARGLVS